MSLIYSRNIAHNYLLHIANNSIQTRNTCAALPRPPLRASLGFKNINDAYNVDIWSLEPAKPWKPALVC